MKFSYEVKSVDTTNKTMDVQFSAENEESLLVALPIPETGVDVREHVAGYAPIQHWEQKRATVQDISVGTAGDVWSEHPTETDVEYAARIAAEEASETPA